MRCSEKHSIPQSDYLLNLSSTLQRAGRRYERTAWRSRSFLSIQVRLAANIRMIDDCPLSLSKRPRTQRTRRTYPPLPSPPNIYLAKVPLGTLLFEWKRACLFVRVHKALEACGLGGIVTVLDLDKSQAIQHNCGFAWAAPAIYILYCVTFRLPAKSRKLPRKHSDRKS